MTFGIRTYNCEDFVVDALHGAFSQTYSPTEIVIVDDCSTDKTFELVKREVDRYRGNHNVKLIKNGKNLGCGGTLNRIYRQSEGGVIIIADGDDISLQNRTQKTFETFRCLGKEFMGVVCYAQVIDYIGEPIPNQFLRPNAESWTAKQVARHWDAPVGAISAFRRRVFDVGVPLAGVPHSDDSILGLRSLAIGRMGTIRDILVHRRAHLHNISGPAARLRSGEETRRWLTQHLREDFLVSNTMIKDIIKLRSDGLISETEANEIFDQLRLHLRQLRLLRVIPRLKFRGQTGIYKQLSEIGFSRRDYIRIAMQLRLPSLAAMLLRQKEKYGLGRVVRG